MIRNKTTYPTDFMNRDYTLNGYDADSEKLINDRWVRDHLYNAQVHDYNEKLCGVIEHLLVQTAVLDSKIEELGRLSGIMISLLRESPKPSWLMHPNPTIRELFNASEEDLKAMLNVLYGVKSNYE